MVIRSPHADIPIPDQDILSFLFGDGNDLPNDPLWINAADASKCLSFRTGLQWIKRLAVGLDKLGLKKGDVVMVVTPNTIFVPVAYLGTVGSGRIFSGANPAYTADEMSYQMKDLSASIVLVHPTLLNTARKAARAIGLPETRLYLFSDHEQKAVDNIKDWRSLLGSFEEATAYSWPQLQVGKAREQVATVNYSSGTTGLPKGVMITHGNLVANAEQVHHTIRASIAASPAESPVQPAPERWLGFLPLYHAYGQLNCILLAVRLMIPIYIMTTFVYEDCLNIIQTHKITELHVAPPVMVLLQKHPATPKYDLSSVKKVTCGAAPLSPALQNDCAKQFNMLVRQAWGMTELTCAALSLPIGVPDDTGSVGHLLPNCEIRLLDDAGKEVATGERGEIHIRGPNASPGYWRNEAATRETMLEGGWLKTGDVAVSDEKGWFWIVDRLKELIKVSGHQVAPAELEAVLLTHPAVADAGVVGVQDSFGAQESPRAYIQLKGSGSITAKAIQEWIKGKVAKHKYLTGGVVFVEQIPKSPAGKIQRKILREWAQRGSQAQGSRPKL